MIEKFLFKILYSCGLLEIWYFVSFERCIFLFWFISLVKWLIYLVVIFRIFILEIFILFVKGKIFFNFINVWFMFCILCCLCLLVVWCWWLIFVSICFFCFFIFCLLCWIFGLYVFGFKFLLFLVEDCEEDGEFCIWFEYGELFFIFFLFD